MTFYIFLIFYIIIEQLISSPLCINNTNYCSQCNNSTNLCEKCLKPRIFIPDEFGGCKPSHKCFPDKNHCKKCDSSRKLCSICEQFYYPDENGACSYTIGCEISYKGECLKCKNEFALVGTQLKLCKSLLLTDYKNCLEINEITGFCRTCEEGYELQLGDYKCTKLKHCNESIYDNCMSCDPTYYYNKKEDKCLMKELELTYCKISLDGNNCDVCDYGYYMDKTGICMKSPFCEETFYFKCTKCIPGYYLSTFNICTTTDNCYEVDQDSFLCNSCQKNYYLNKKNYKCYPNIENSPYKHCSVVDEEKCILCEHGFHLTEDFKCSNTRYCSISENGICYQCSKDYYLGLDNICTNVEGCIYSIDGTCTECEEGYYYHTLNNTCIEMEGIFANCKFTCPIGDRCCECKNDFYLNLNDSLCYDNTAPGPYTKCAFIENEFERCRFCVDGYYLGTDDHKCCKVENCKLVENENKCLECDTFYCLDAKKQECVYNDFLDDLDKTIYISCLRTNEEGTKCEKCIEGYEPNEDGYCVDVEYCEEKKDGKCLKCKDIIIDNYSLCANELFGCIRSASDNCLRCDNLDDLYDCTKCQEGYDKTRFSCEKIEEE